MGVERAVTRWYLQRQRILNDIAGLEGQLAGRQARGKRQEEPGAGELAQQLARARERLRSLGPCPRPMMG